MTRRASPALALLAALLRRTAPRGRAATPAPRILVMPFENVTPRGPHLLAGRSGGGAADRRSQRARRQRDHARRAAAGVRAAAGPAGRGAHRRDGDPHRPAGRRRRRSSSARCRWRTTRWSCTRAASRSTPAASARRHRARAAAGAVRDLRADRAAHGAAVRRPRRRTSRSSIRRSSAFEDYIKGLLAETPATAVSYLRAALAGQPTFDRARLALWDVYAEQGEHARALAAVGSVAGRLAVVSPRPVSRRPVAAQSEEVRRCVRDVQGAGRRAADAAVLNNLGVVQLRRGGTPQAGQPTYFFTKAAEADPDDEDFLSTSATPTGSTRSAGGDLLAARGGAPQSGRRRRALRPRRRARAPAATPPRRRASASWRGGCRRRTRMGKRPGGDAVPKGLERVKHDVELPHARADRDARSRAASSAATTSWRGSISIAAGGCSSRRTIATRSSS